MEMEGKVVTRVADPMTLEMDEKAGIDVEENDAANIDELMEKDTKSEADVGRIIMYRQIGAKVAYYRTLRQLTQDELARRIHISRSTLNRIERGRYNGGISLSTLMDVAEGLHIELSNLVSFTEEEKKVWWDVDVHLK